MHSQRLQDSLGILTLVTEQEFVRHLIYKPINNAPRYMLSNLKYDVLIAVPAFSVAAAVSILAIAGS